MKFVLRYSPWTIFAIAAVFFLMPLFSTAEFSLSIRRGVYSLEAYESVFLDPEFAASFFYSLIIAVLTIIFGTIIVVPMAYYVRLRLQWLRPVVEIFVMLPMVVPPIVLVFGYLRLFSSSSVLPLADSSAGASILLICGCTTLSLPYLYRTIDTGLQTIDVQTLTDAAGILGARPFATIRLVIFPNILPSVMAGAFLTFAIVMGEFVIASLLTRPAFGTYIQKIGMSKAYEPAALTILSFAITWGALAMMNVMTRFSRRAG
ncbi:putative spermidine/putrescine transport system permease protein [Rhizobium pisi]